MGSSADFGGATLLPPYFPVAPHPNTSPSCETWNGIPILEFFEDAFLCKMECPPVLNWRVRVKAIIRLPSPDHGGILPLLDDACSTRSPIPRQRPNLDKFSRVRKYIHYITYSRISASRYHPVLHKEQQT